MTDEIDVIRVRFLDPEHPKPGKQIFNDLIMALDDNIGFLYDHAQAEEFEGRNLIVQINTEKMGRKKLAALTEWEP